MFHRIDSVLADGRMLTVTFADGIIKKYDLLPLMEKIPAFRQLLDFPQKTGDPAVDAGGYGIVWNDDLDLSSEELWENGTEI